MKKEEFKIKIVNKIDNLIDVYYGDENIIDKITNSTLKVFVNTNLDKIDGLLDTFSDNEGNIDVDMIVSNYSKNIPSNGINFDIRDYIKNDFIISLLPNKSLNITKEDFDDLKK